MFTDRKEAGTLLAQKLTSYVSSGALVLGLARGGVVVAHQVAKQLFLPLDVLVVKKIPSPHDPELALGAVAPDGIRIVNWRLAQQQAAGEDYMKSQSGKLTDLIKQKALLYRKGKKPLTVKDTTVIIVDDGAATGATFEVAVRWARAKGARKIVAALPVAPRDTLGRIVPEVDESVVLVTPEDFMAVGQFYREFGQTEDEEVIQLLHA